MGLSVKKMEKVAFVLKTTAHPTRIAIVQLLAAHDSLSVSNISERLSVEQSLLSHHLSGMKLKGILSSTRDGKNIYYALKMREVIDEVDLRQKANNIQTKRQELAARLHHSLHEKLMPLTADVPRPRRAQPLLQGLELSQH